MLAYRNFCIWKHFTYLISSDDIVRAVGTLRPLGSGYKILDLGGRRAVQSVPLELSPDSSVLLKFAEQEGHLSAKEATSILGWQPERFTRVMDTLLKAELAWIDEQSSDGITLYWFPCFYRAFV